MTRVAAFVPDLMDRSRFTAPVEWVSEVEHLAAVDADLLIVDLSRPGVLEALSTLATTIPVVGFAPHVDDQLLAHAADRGIEALSRSVFFRRLGALLEQDVE